MRRLLPVIFLAACVSDAKAPSTEAEALATIREVFETRVRGDGTAVEDARSVRATREGVEWLQGDAERRLSWADVETIESQTDQEKPARPETLYLYLARGSRSVETAAPERPPLSGSEIVRCYVLLRDRPAGSRARLVHALDVLGRSRPKPVEAAPVASRSTVSVEERLRKLKELHEKGLIDDDVYKDEQRKALSGF